MSELDQVIEKHVNTVVNEIKGACGYQLNDAQIDELRLTGRVGISLTELAPYFDALNKFIKSHHINWVLSLNTISSVSSQ
ncbi:hypothetical protein [Limosilactobacillus reuteri]|uniref:hypothetical protein n=1 Tax=Limosilactobacillus reuteri TaxID=1598 RepID=UPI00081BCD70|nr:hypothetical protein [Limosilactobacillus reuteri]MCH5380481.1 hypothetical protein [Limosilactobacillus reuteri]OCW61385.1 hypothetical protein BBP12_09995 [Limosilactobacillus reuteri]OCW66551.1 hypothetical protein BBP10_10690 [Limosilactobacillus reuteri]OCW67074.1 hypothetical protein BBP13_09895 [Limosilactobacillus reuteri]OCW67076.1 hypothetical protein BBP12_10325 [Limosilactobacillus reuteri]